VTDERTFCLAEDVACSGSYTAVYKFSYLLTYLFTLTASNTAFTKQLCFRTELQSTAQRHIFILQQRQFKLGSVTYGPRSFAVSGPTVWNTLPSTLRVSTTTLGQFQSEVKTILFRLAYKT